MLWSSFHFPLIFYPIALLSTNTYITISSNGALKPNLARGCLKPFYSLSKKGVMHPVSLKWDLGVVPKARSQIRSVI